MSKINETKKLNGIGFSAESIKIMGESIGVSSQSLADDAARKLSEDVTDRVKILIRDALKFMHHSKRNCLTTDDIEYAMKMHKIEPQYGFQSADAEPFRFAAGGGRELHFMEEKEANLDEILMDTPPKIPLQVRLRTHWLAVDGQQPSIQENPPPMSVAQQASVATNPLIKLDLSVLTLNDKRRMGNDSGGASGGSSGVGGACIGRAFVGKSSKLLNTEIVQVKQLAVHELSVEKQLYFKQITEALISTDAHRRIQALNSLSTDPGLFEICPRLCVFIAEGVKVNVAQHNLGSLINLVRAVSSLVNNSTLYVEKYLHDLVPAVITCIVSKQVSECPQVDAHWSLRTYAANLIGRICKIYNNTTNNLQTRITRIYNNGLENPKMYLTTMYGALVGLCSLGHEVIQIFIIPKLKSISQRIENKIFNGTPDAMDKLTADRIRTVISTYCSPILAEMREAPDFVDDYRNDYGTCFATALCFGVLQARGTTSMTATTTMATTSANTINTLATTAAAASTTTTVTAGTTALVTIPNELSNTLTLPTMQQTTTPQVVIPARVVNSNRFTAVSAIAIRAPVSASRLPLPTTLARIPTPATTRAMTTATAVPATMAAVFPKNLSLSTSSSLSSSLKTSSSLLKRSSTQNVQATQQSQSMQSSVYDLETVEEEIIIIDDV